MAFARSRGELKPHHHPAPPAPYKEQSYHPHAAWSYPRCTSSIHHESATVHESPAIALLTTDSFFTSNRALSEEHRLPDRTCIMSAELFPAQPFMPQHAISVLGLGWIRIPHAPSAHVRIARPRGKLAASDSWMISGNWLAQRKCGCGANRVRQRTLGDETNPLRQAIAQVR